MTIHDEGLMAGAGKNLGGDMLGRLEEKPKMISASFSTSPQQVAEFSK